MPEATRRLDWVSLAVLAAGLSCGPSSVTTAEPAVTDGERLALDPSEIDPRHDAVACIELDALPESWSPIRLVRRPPICDNPFVGCPEWLVGPGLLAPRIDTIWSRREVGRYEIDHGLPLNGDAATEALVRGVAAEIRRRVGMLLEMGICPREGYWTWVVHGRGDASARANLRTGEGGFRPRHLSGRMADPAALHGDVAGFHIRDDLLPDMALCTTPQAQEARLHELQVYVRFSMSKLAQLADRAFAERLLRQWDELGPAQVGRRCEPWLEDWRTYVETLPEHTWPEFGAAP